ncbi:MAG: serine/threonine-protein kinase [Planctomycetota bacterium]|nr:serine/threonine-protein kinase [Planctomycetota bacterium]
MASGRDFVGPYRLVKLIRAGTSCQVWEVVKDPDPRRIALKVLLEEHKGTRAEVQQLKNEGMVGIGLEHKNVIKIFEFTDKHHLPCIVMELFNARNLKQELRERPENLLYHAPGIIRQCGLGLNYFNEQGFVHCDIKPDNFLVNAAGEVKLIDFSIAKKIKSGISGLFAGKQSIQGTRSYMSPEQIRGKKLDQRSDIYGLGCVIFELVVGKPPFTASSPDELLHRHLTAPPPSATVYNNRVSPDLSALIQKMLSKDLQRRPETVKMFLEEFRTIQTYKAGLRPKNPDKDVNGY